MYVLANRLIQHIRRAARQHAPLGAAPVVTLYSVICIKGLSNHPVIHIQRHNIPLIVTQHHPEPITAHGLYFYKRTCNHTQSLCRFAIWQPLRRGSRRRSKLQHLYHRHLIIGALPFEVRLWIVTSFLLTYLAMTPDTGVACHNSRRPKLDTV